LSHPRSCVNSRTGRLKITYAVQLEAELVALALTLRNRESEVTNAYRCEVHGGWHVGREPRWDRQWLNVTLRGELGARAWNCLLRENGGSRDFRVKLVMHLGRVAAQRRGEDPYAERNRC